MNGILTQNGIAEWLNGAKSFVKEWDRVAVNSTQSAKIIAFKNSSEGSDIANSSSWAGGPVQARRSDTSFKTEGRFQNENFVATHLALEFENQVVIDTTAGNDVLPLPADVKEFNARAWFSMYFGSGNEAHDEGQYLDFPSGRGLTGIPTATAANAEAMLHSNGIPSEMGLKTMKKPYRCTPDTKPRMEIEFLWGALGLSADGGLRAFVLGYK